MLRHFDSWGAKIWHMGKEAEGAEEAAQKRKKPTQSCTTPIFDAQVATQAAQVVHTRPEISCVLQSGTEDIRADPSLRDPSRAFR